MEEKEPISNESEEIKQEEKTQKVEVKEETSKLKEETVSTVKQVKESVKNVNIKEETKRTQGFVTEMFKNPIAKIREVAKDNSNKYLKTGIFILIIWTILAIIHGIAGQSNYYNILVGYHHSIWYNILEVIKTGIVPILSVVILSAIILLVNKKEKKSLTSLIAMVVTALVPMVISSAVQLLNLISNNAPMLTRPFHMLCVMISSILLYFGAKESLQEKEDGKFIKTFVIIGGIYFLVSVILMFLDIKII